MYGDGRSIVVLNGGGPDHRCMTGCLEPAFRGRDGWKRFYLDLPGTGKTQGREWIRSSDQMLDVVLDFIAAVIPGQRFVLAGSSYGAYLARGVLYRQPAQVDGLLMICPVVTPSLTERALPPHVTLMRDAPFMDSLPPAQRELFGSFAVVQTPRTWERTRDEVIVGLELADMGFLARLQAHGYALSFDVDDPSVRFEKPTLILLGRQDAMVGYRDAWTLVESYPRATFALLDRAGHNLPIEQERLFAALVEEWLDRVEEGQ
jgi:pimeloyl-ACP methyl ester carboxylesterase